MLTWVICYRMVTHGLKVKKRLGKDFASVYFALLSLIIESVLPYTLSGTAFLVSFGVGSDTSIAFASVYILLMVSGPIGGSTTRANGSVVYITTAGDTACGIWTGMERGDGQGTAVDAQV